MRRRHSVRLHCANRAVWGGYICGILPAGQVVSMFSSVPVRKTVGWRVAKEADTTETYRAHLRLTTLGEVQSTVYG